MNTYESVSDVTPRCLATFDEVIDVRSPAEFKLDHIPGAINLFVLDDRERAEVGTIYRNRSRFEARRIGAAYISNNVAGHLAEHFEGFPKTYRPLLYCWRGGMRSQAMATILAAIGWRVSVLTGGYRTWRSEVVAQLRDAETNFHFILIDGQTGTSKTAILEMLARDGCQTLDLEGLAEHRGSVFGAFDNRQQPSQKQFESRVWFHLNLLDVTRPIVVEAESAKIGRCAIPDRVLRSMRCAPRIELRASIDARARNLIESYSDLLTNPRRLANAIERLQPYHSHALIETWLKWVRAEDYQDLASDLMEHHYDPRYERQRNKRNDNPLKVINLGDLDKADLRLAARCIASFVERQLDGPTNLTANVGQ